MDLGECTIELAENGKEETEVGESEGEREQGETNKANRFFSFRSLELALMH